VVNAAPVKFEDSRDIRQLVTHSGRKQQLPASETVSVAQREVKTIVVAPGGLDKARPYLDSVGLKLIPGNLQEVEGVDTVARQIAMESVRCGISRLSFVADENTPAAPAQNQSRT
jgi:hypothetical protein